MGRLLKAVRIGLLDMRGDLRRFALLVVCLAVGTALIAGVNLVGATITRAVNEDTALLMGGDIELSRADRPADAGELALFARYGQVAQVTDTNVRAENGALGAFVDLVSVDEAYPLLGSVRSLDLAEGERPAGLLAPREGVPGALLDPLLLDQLGLSVGDEFEIGGTVFEARGTFRSLPDGPVRGFRLGMPALITIEALQTISDRTSPLPGLGTWFRYKLLFDNMDAEAGRAEIEAALDDPGWTVRSARDGLGPMVRYYDLFMSFLVIVGLASLLIGGVSVWTSISAYVAERANVIAILRSMGSGTGRIFIHFLSQVAVLALVGVGIGLLVGTVAALLVLPTIGEAVGIALTARFDPRPLLVAGGVGLLTAFAFSYLPLQQAQTITPVSLFRSKGLGIPPIDWRRLMGSVHVLPMIGAVIGFLWLAILMTGDPRLVGAFAIASLLSVLVFRAAVGLAQGALRRMGEPSNRLLRHALRAIADRGSNAVSVVISVGMALAMLVVVLVLEVNLRNEFLGASVFDAPTLVASDLFSDEVEDLAELSRTDPDIALFTFTPMLRGTLSAIDGVAADEVRTRGPEASFLSSGEVPLTYRSVLPPTSRIVSGAWWAADHAGPPLVSLHHSLRNGLGVELGDTLSFTIFGEEITAEIASFRDYSWQGGIDFLATFSPGVLEDFPATLFGAVTAVPGREEAVERRLAETFQDVRFIAIGETLELITDALRQLSFAASLVGALAVSNGLLVLIGSLTAGRRQREADAVINTVLGATRGEVIVGQVIQYLILGSFAALLATPLGIGLAAALAMVLLDVQFTIGWLSLGLVDLGAIGVTTLLGVLTLSRALRVRPARLLREFEVA
ncbi:FtsX-like permease family protein [Arsenicitalea aurantiaca]|uniref:FtsX-like permease family protein n=1 Tax=Arsenicitalea aurantiaca TaxID=1783274 RepID=A0A433XKZ5_9HYPH|nr:FtsX-like permease family protein [Arsenicitalea aurantiaca]RUT34755.1 FtsX-like permease family protein [Arsenicitalea aurantiaca]